MTQKKYFPNPDQEEVCDFFDVVPGDLFSLKFKSAGVLRVVILAPKRYEDLQYKALD